MRPTRRDIDLAIDEISGVAGMLAVGAMFAGFALVGFCMIAGAAAYASLMTALDPAYVAIRRVSRQA